MNAEYFAPGIQKTRNSDIQESRNSEIQEFRISSLFIYLIRRIKGAWNKQHMIFCRGFFMELSSSSSEGGHLAEISLNFVFRRNLVFLLRIFAKFGENLAKFHILKQTSTFVTISIPLT